MAKEPSSGVADDSGISFPNEIQDRAGTSTQSQAQISAVVSSPQAVPTYSPELSTESITVFPEANTTSPETNAADEAEIAAHPNRRYQILSIRSHTLDHENFTVSLDIEWAGGQITTEDEGFLQRDIPSMIFEYWNNLGGRTNATNFELWHWVGFCADECTWELAEKLAGIAPEVKNKYDQAKCLKN
ncbi:hypothetical protein ACHAPA_011954 [Fusarium lateritium]